MTEWKLPWGARCRCGKVRMHLSEPPLVSMACHCTGCQRMTGGAYSLSLAIPTEGFAVTQGEPVIGGIHGATRHYFCDHCLSWIFTRPEGLDFFVNVRATMLDDASWVVPFVETWTREALPNVVSGATHSFETLPPNEAFKGLMEDYARRGVRPRA